MIRPIIIGDDKGLKYTYTDENVKNGQVYYYAVTAYDVQSKIRSGAAPVTLESSQSSNAIRVTPQPSTLGNQITAGAQDTATHAGPSDGVVLVKVVDPKAITGHTYKVIFENVTVIDTVAKDTSTQIMWKLFNVNKNAFVKFFRADDPNTTIDESFYQVNQVSATDPSTAEAFVTVDGLQIRVFGPALDFKNFLVISNASGVLNPPDYGAFAFNSSGFPHPTTGDRPSDAQQVGGGHWGIHTADNGSRSSYTSFINRTTRDGGNWKFIVPYDFEIRFTATGGYAFDAYNAGDTSFAVPFELWNIGVGTPNDPSDDYRMVPWLLDDDGSGTFNMGDTTKGAGTYDHSISGGDNDPYTDWIYWMNPRNKAPGQASYLVAQAEMIANTYDGSLETEEVMARTVLVNWNGDTASTLPGFKYNQPLPETGTTFRILSTKPNAAIDTFTFNTSANTPFNAALAKTRLNKNYVKVVPNPYYGFSAYDQNQFNRRVKITGLPNDCTIRIFNIAGDLVRTLRHNSSSNNERGGSAAEFTSVEIWDLTSDNGIFVSSGVYFMYIDAPGIGKSEELIPFAIIQGSVQLTVPTN